MGEIIMSGYAIALTIYLVWLFGVEMMGLPAMAKRKMWDGYNIIGAVIGLSIRNGIIFALLAFGGFYS